MTAPAFMPPDLAPRRSLRRRGHQQGLRAAGIDGAQLARLKGSDPSKLALAKLLWKHTTVSQEWIAERPAMRSAANVSQQLRRRPIRRWSPSRISLDQNGRAVSVHGPQGSAVAGDPLIRAFLLAHDVPTISQPTGSDDVSFADGPIDPDKNTDMPDDLRSSAWGNWEHSDLKNEPMGRGWKLFSDMVSRSELNEHFTPPPIR